MPDFSPRPIRLMTLAPGHFHAALVQKRMLPGVAPRAYVYAPLDDDTAQHVARVAAFNARPDDPTGWRLDVRAGADYLDRFLREQPGNTVVLSGRNKPKIDLMLAAAAQGLHVLADKPWVIDPADFSKLDDVFREADLRDVVAWDVMTERFEVTNALQRELLRDPEVYGEQLPGTPDEPGLALESVHYLKKTVAGVPLRRPWWWFDVTEVGDGLADVGTHLADLALWLLSPDRAIDHRTEVQVLDADRWPLPLAWADFRAITGLPDFPPALDRWVSGGVLRYFGNGAAVVTVRGVHVRLTTIWDVEAAPGRGDTHEAVARGSRATVAIRHDPSSGPQPELFVQATSPADRIAVAAAVARRCREWQPDYPGVSADDLGDRVHVRVPAALRAGHEAHFASVLGEFVQYFRFPRSVPAWERPNLLAKYFITTTAVEIARGKTGGA